MNDTPVSRGEFDLLRDMVTAGASRMENIDQHGTRGVAVIQEQVTEVIRDLTSLKIENDIWQKGHTSEHNQERKDRISGRRWTIGTVIAGLAGLATVIGLLVDVLSKVHH